MSPSPEATGRVLVVAVLASAMVLLVSGVIGWNLGSRDGMRAEEPSVPTSVPVVVFLGDSYAEGVGASSIGKRWTTLGSAAMGWSEINASASGMGYTTTYQGLPTNYSTRVDVVAAAKPDIVVVSGGRNDYQSADITAAAVSLFEKVRAAAPDARLVVISPIWDSTPVPGGFVSVTDEVRRAADTAGAEYIDVGQPLGGHPDMIEPDGLHPNDLGHRAIASAVVQHLS